MSIVAGKSPLEQLLEPLAAGFTSEMARYVADFRADSSIQDRIAQLAGKANEGDLSDQEREEYQEFIDAGTLIAILQAKARKRLGSSL